MYSHSPERVAASLHLSELVYEAAHAQVDGETRDRQTLRLGMTTLGYLLRFGDTVSDAGNVVHALLLTQLAKAGVTPLLSVYDAWPNYSDVIGSLPIPPAVRMGGDLTSFANAYADVRRATMDKNGLETDASHVFHSAALALPYAAQNYPSLNQGKLAAYFWVHDAPERFAGDTPTIAISEKELAEKYAREKRAMPLLQEELADYPELFTLIEQYELQQDAESRFVRTWDKHDTGFSHFLNDGKALGAFPTIQTVEDFHNEFLKITKRMTYGAQFPMVMEDRGTLLNEVAQIIPWANLPDAKIET